MQLFSLENISKQFSGKFILDNFSYQIFSGDKINIAGPSGIGKSTLFKLLLGFEKADKGNIAFKNKPITPENIWEVRKEIAYISQDVQIGHGTVSTLFSDTLSYKTNLPVKAVQSGKIAGFLSQFDLTKEILEKRIEKLSGGEKQRIAIINALLLNRKIYFLDETTSALDQQLKEKVMDFFLGNEDFTVLYISHDSYCPQNTKIKTIRLTDYPPNRV